MISIEKIKNPEDKKIESPSNKESSWRFGIEWRDWKIDFEKKNFLPRNGGKWEGEIGNSKWNPNDKEIPGNSMTNPEGKTWEQIKKEYDFDSINFKDGEPDFSVVSKGEVTIDDFTDDRDYNFTQADEKLAEQRDCNPDDIRKWRKENKYTWHECKDCKTMQLVPTEVHGNIPHSGGISAYKSQHKLD